jgi:hypothetical protein
MGDHVRARTKIAIGVGMLLLGLLLTVLVAWWQTQPEPPLGVGTTIAEVQDVMGVQDTWLWCQVAEAGDSWKVVGMQYVGEPDFMGTIRHTYIYLDDDGRVTHWWRGYQSGRPPWLERIMKCLGW